MTSYRHKYFDIVFADICDELINYPQYESSPRGQLVKEQLARTFCLTNPRARLINNPARKANYGFAVGEFLWYWSGRDDLETMLYYNKRMAGFSDDGNKLNSAYGFRLRKDVKDASGNTQWDDVIDTLLADNDSRRAVMTIYSPADMRTAVSVGSKDVPCTLSLQFFIREKKLHLHTVMRSNDVFWGLTWDLFSFTLFQECMLLELKMRGMDIELGEYYHTAGSIHIYERHFDEAARVVAHYDNRGINDFPQWDPCVKMDPLVAISSLNELCWYEQRLRKGEIQSIPLECFDGAERWMAEKLNLHRIKIDSRGKDL